jgi:crotonobetainyl-CoA:carnitine CoA-transferase CaiB-like acyl-CoA transferase
VSISPTPSAPLTGMRVVDLSQQLPGPYCTLLLAALGAQVTKVEPPSGDAARHLDPEMFGLVSAGKRSIRLDLKTDADRQRLWDLVRESDVLVEGFRPGVTSRLGCDFTTLAEVNPRLLYCSISGFGQTGPDARRPTHDLSLQAVVGALSSGAVVDSVGVPWVDLGTATTAALLVAAHWPTDQAVHLDLSMLDTASSWARVKPSAVSRREPTYGTFTTSDGSVFVLALLEDAMWKRLCAALDLTAWSAEEGLGEYAARVERDVVVRRRVQAELGRLTADDVVRLAHEHDLPLDRVQDLEAGSRHPQVAWRRSQSSDRSGIVPFGWGTGVSLPALSEADVNQPYG